MKNEDFEIPDGNIFYRISWIYRRALPALVEYCYCGTLLAVLIYQKAFNAFFLDFWVYYYYGVDLAWWIDMKNNGVLSKKIASILPLGGNAFVTDPGHRTGWRIGCRICGYERKLSKSQTSQLALNITVINKYGQYFL